MLLLYLCNLCLLIAVKFQCVLIQIQSRHITKPLRTTVAPYIAVKTAC